MANTSVNDYTSLEKDSNYRLLVDEVESAFYDICDATGSAISREAVRNGVNCIRGCGHKTGEVGSFMTGIGYSIMHHSKGQAFANVLTNYDMLSGLHTIELEDGTFFVGLSTGSRDRAKSTAMVYALLWCLENE